MMQTREKAMRAAAARARFMGANIATAGADAELARVLAFMREDADAVEGAQTELDRLIAEAIRELADAIEAHSHWKDDQ
jgi:hypothetical protein